jgi:hypothetical protein
VCLTLTEQTCSFGIEDVSKELQTVNKIIMFPEFVNTLQIQKNGLKKKE